MHPEEEEGITRRRTLQEAHLLLCKDGQKVAPTPHSDEIIMPCSTREWKNSQASPWQGGAKSGEVVQQDGEVHLPESTFLTVYGPIC